MRILVCGDRNWSNWHAMGDVFRLEANLDDVIIEGEARGADKMARSIAEAAGLEVLRFPADWEKYGRAAGPIRNSQMLSEGKPEAVWAFHNDIISSKGTRDMVKKSLKKGLPVRLFTNRGEIQIPEELK